MVTLEDVSTEELFSEMLRRMKCVIKGVQRVILVGPPGCGKGTQSPFIKAEYCLCHLATGDMLRDAGAKQTALGKEVKAAMESLDATLAKQGHSIDTVLNFDIPDCVLEERITGRWVHIASGRSYHITKFVPPKVPGRDDITGEKLIQRKDDNAEVLRSRLDAFHKQTTPASCASSYIYGEAEICISDHCTDVESCVSLLLASASKKLKQSKK